MLRGTLPGSTWGCVSVFLPLSVPLLHSNKEFISISMSSADTRQLPYLIQKEEPAGYGDSIASATALTDIFGV